MDNMREEIFKRLDLIGVKLGVAAEALWPMLVWRVQVVGGVKAAVGALVLAVIAYCWWLKPWIVTNRHGEKEVDGDIIGGLIALTVFVGAIAVALLAFGLVSLLAPEAEALNDIVEALK